MSIPTTAVLVIDVQQGLFEGKHAVFDSEQLLARINQVTAKARAAGAPVIFVQHQTDVDFLRFQTPSWELASGLHVEASDLRIRKCTPDAFLGTELESLLDEHGIADLVICGVHTEFCVDTTARRAMALGYPVVLVQDGHSSEGNAHLTPSQVIWHHNTTLTHIHSFGPRVRLQTAADLQFGD
ncbi:MAG: cysteine hydrolase [Gammaproteobacteria bacterium]|nr:cysteine hydrolase [Gammaproteobacteria bacterium]MBU1440913.1 cysteine hydrolase [Gammaproteobacteria bacterium]MBU2286810.1 cysteine hydrolase [Gammaproteobacteria bacterium]MBU2408946.1 cysteine hydrolase [Gammaproteobacteria bacterium]